MKFKSLLPVALMAMLMTPAFAATATSQTSLMTITLNDFINITKGTEVLASTASFNDTYTTITLAPQMNAQYQVITNKPGDQVRLTGTTDATSAGLSALYGTSATSINLVFCNQTVKPADTAVTNITGMTETDATLNANAIAFAVTPTVAGQTATGATASPTATPSLPGTITYTLATSGIYDFNYDIATTAVAKTFSTHDAAGSYTATLTLSQVPAVVPGP